MSHSFLALILLRATRGRQLSISLQCTLVVTAMPSSAGSQASSLGSAFIVEKNPTLRDGVMYMRIRRCPCCQLTNACQNPLPSGPLGAEHFETLPWKTGTSTNPVGPICRLCYIILHFGGFLAQFGGDLVKFVNHRRISPELMNEWNAAYKHLVDNCGQLPGKFKQRAEVPCWAAIPSSPAVCQTRRVFCQTQCPGTMGGMRAMHRRPPFHR